MTTKTATMAPSAGDQALHEASLRRAFRIAGTIFLVMNVGNLLLCSPHVLHGGEGVIFLFWMTAGLCLPSSLLSVGALAWIIVPLVDAIGIEPSLSPPVTVLVFWLLVVGLACWQWFWLFPWLFTRKRERRMVVVGIFWQWFWFFQWLFTRERRRR